ncbi:MAG: hypothetical protein IAF08_01765 [Rhizobacter sp.]|nr:hypothetical protein [Chlorobiales bacterium]
MAVLAKPLLAFVRRHLMTLPLFSTWHDAVLSGFEKFVFNKRTQRYRSRKRLPNHFEILKAILFFKEEHFRGAKEVAAFAMPRKPLNSLSPA